jgi:two-component sensor histidine kinase
MWIQGVCETFDGQRTLGVLAGAGCVAAALALQFLIGTPLAHVMFYPAIMLSAFFAGRPGGYAALAASAGLAWWLYVPPATRLAPHTEHLLGLATFAFMGAIVIELTATLTGALLRLGAERREAQRAREEVSALMAEMGHRSRNELVLIEAIARSVTPKTPEGQRVLREFRTRLHGLAHSSELLTRTPEGVPLDALIAGQTRPFCAPERVRASGPSLLLTAAAVRYLGMALHELCTNATKHGALSTEHGHVEFRWRVQGDRVGFLWRERGGPPVAEPVTSGLGRNVLSRLVPQALDGDARLEFAPMGLEWRLDAPLGAVEQPLPRQRAA